jgi:hypothetical protein
VTRKPACANGKFSVWKAGEPLLLGCALIGLGVGVAGYLAFRLWWPDRKKPNALA